MSYDKNSLECPFCRKSGDGDVVIDSKELVDQHFDKKLPKTLECKKCGATAEKGGGCCVLRYRWSIKGGYDDVARFECSDCGDSYYARIKERAGRFEIGEKVSPPPAAITVRKQRMLCGGCQGQGGKGDRLNDLMKSQARIMDDLMGR